MKLRIFKTVMTGVLCALVSMPALAQEDDGGPQTQGDDAKYLSVTYTQYKPGMREGAMEIINEHFIPATQKAGTPEPILVIHFQTGRWDVAAVWQMEGGMADLEWYRSPNNIKWFEALAELAGGVEEAEAIVAKYTASVANSETDVGHHHVRDAD